MADAAEPAAVHYDGRSATRYSVHVRMTSDGFALDGDGGDTMAHRWSDLVALDGTGGRAVYGLNGVEGWRLIFTGPPPMAFAAHLPLPARYGRWIDRFGLMRASVAFVILATAAIAAVLSAPRWIAPLVPQSVEARLGDAMIGDLGGRFCRTQDGRKALDRLVAAIHANDARVRSVEVANIPMVNAVTLPGGRIILFDGLLRQARSPDEVAGVLAHEFGHVRHRDTMAALIRQLGLSVVLGGVDGNVGGLLNGALSLSYGRDAERAADAYAIDTLRAAAIAPDATAAFLDRMGRHQRPDRVDRALTWLSSHPVSADRKAAFLKSRQPGRTYRPVLVAADWQALRRMCAADPDARQKTMWSW